MTTLIKHISSLRKRSKFSEFTKEETATLKKYLEGKLEWNDIQSLLFKYSKYDNYDDGQLIIKAAKEYLKSKLTADELTRYFKITYHIWDAYYYLPSFCKDCDITLEAAFYTFDLNLSELAKKFCTYKDFLPNPYCLCYFNANPLKEKFDKVYGINPEAIRSIARQDDKMFELIYFPERARFNEHRGHPEEYKNLTGLTYFKAAAYLYSKEPAPELKEALIKDAARRIVLAMMCFGTKVISELKENIKKIDKSAALYLENAVNELADVKAKKYNTNVFEDFSGCKQCLDDFFMGIALSDFSINELNCFLQLFVNMNDTLKKEPFSGRSVVQILAYILSAFDNKGESNRDGLGKYLNILAKHEILKEAAIEHSASYGYDCTEALGGDTALFERLFPVLEGYAKAVAGRSVWQQNKCLEYVKLCEDEVINRLKTEIKIDTTELQNWLTSGGVGAVPHLDKIEIPGSWHYIGVTSKLHGYSKFTDLFTRFVIEDMQETIFEKYKGFLIKNFATNSEMKAYCLSCTNNHDNVNKFWKKHFPEEENKATPAPEAKKETIDNTKFIAEKGFMYSNLYDSLVNDNELNEEYEDICAKLEKLRKKNEKLTGFSLWSHEVYGGIQGWEVREVLDEKGRSDIKHGDELFMFDEYMLDAMGDFGYEDDDEEDGDEDRESGEKSYAMLCTLIARLHREGKFAGLIHAYPFPVCAHIEVDGATKVLTIYDEKGATPNADDVMALYNEIAKEEDDDDDDDDDYDGDDDYDDYDDEDDDEDDDEQEEIAQTKNDSKEINEDSITTHYLTCTENGSDKFWKIEIDNAKCKFTVTFGKTNASGTSQVKEFGDEETCKKEADKLIASKLKKGYVESENVKKSKDDLLKERIVNELLGIEAPVVEVVKLEGGIPEEKEKTFAGGMEMVFVQGGEFEMSVKAATTPRHFKRLSHYYFSKYPVTQKQWEEIMGNNPSQTQGDNFPVTDVSWNDVQEFIKKLNEKTGLTYSLPTDTEWEYAALGGINNDRSDDYETMQKHPDYIKPYPAQYALHDVGMNEPNSLGIYDTGEYIQEWCQDWYQSATPKKENPLDFAGHFGYEKMTRGGFELYHRGWYLAPNKTRYVDHIAIGFRLVLRNAKPEVKILAKKEGRSGMFWAIQNNGIEYTISSDTGKVGYGKMKFIVKQFKDAEACKKEVDKLIAKQLAEGFTDAFSTCKYDYQK